VIEEDRAGGVCLNWGCIPSKALLTGAELVDQLRNHGDTFGIAAGSLVLDYGKVIDHSRKSADRLCKGVQSLFKKNQITLVRGRGRLASPTRVASPATTPARSTRTACCSRPARPSGYRRRERRRRARADVARGPRVEAHAPIRS
jgi:dihydrolipoamide dehydrogenase